MGNNRALSWLIRVPGAVLWLGCVLGSFYFALAFGCGIFVSLRNSQWVTTLMGVGCLAVILILGVTLARAGWRMMQAVDKTTVSNFSFLFAWLIAYQLYRVMQGSWVEAQFTYKEFLVFLALGLFFFYYWVIKKCLTSALRLEERRLG